MLSIDNKPFGPMCDLAVLRFFHTMKLQLSQLPKIVGSGRVVHLTRPFFCLALFNSIS
jgi:hypothetical protein